MTESLIRFTYGVQIWITVFFITFFWFMTLFSLVGDYSLIIETCCHYLTRRWEQCVLGSSGNDPTNYPEVEGNRFFQTLSNHLPNYHKEWTRMFSTSIGKHLSVYSVAYLRGAKAEAKIVCVGFTVFSLSWIQVTILSFGVSTVYILLSWRQTAVHATGFCNDM